MMRIELSTLESEKISQKKTKCWTEETKRELKKCRNEENKNLIETNES